MRADGIAVNLVAQALEVEQHRRIDRQHLLPPVGKVKHLAPLAPVVRALGNADQRHVLDAQFLQRVAYARHLALAAIDQHQIGPHAPFTIRVFLHRAGEAAAHHFAHHGEVVVRLGALDVELAILVLDEAFRPRHHHRAHGLGALDMAVVVDFDAGGNVGEFKELRHLAHDLRLRAAFRQPPVQRLCRIAAGLLHQLASVAPLGDADFHPAPRQFAESLFQQFLLRQGAVDQDSARRRNLFVELRQDARQNVCLVQILRVSGKEGLVPPVLSAAHEESLHADLATLGRQREHVRITHAISVHGLRSLDEGGRAQPVAQQGSGLEVEIFRSLLHLLLYPRLYRAGLAAEEILRLAQQLVVAFLVDPPHARRAAPLDLVEQAGPVAAGEEAIGAGS